MAGRWRQEIGSHGRTITPGAGESATGPRSARVTFLGHSTLLIEIDGLRVLTDPVLHGLGPVRRQVDPVDPDVLADVDAVFISHGHHDHLDLASLRRIPGRPVILVPRGLGVLASRARVGPVAEVVPGDRVVIDGVPLEVVPAAHDGRRRPFGPDADAIGCLVGTSETMYFAGDTDLFADMAALRGRIDVALLPVWGWGPRLGPGHLDPLRAAAAVEVLAPRVAVPIHWGTLYPVGLRQMMRTSFDAPGPAFQREVAARALDVHVQVLRPGDSLEVPSRAGTAPLGAIGPGSVTRR
ncbi:MAG: MBL fold metallo-hydrolase [Chloroflexota bacterium]